MGEGLWLSLMITTSLPPRQIFPASEKFKVDLVKVGLEFQLSKFACYIVEEHQDEE